VPSTEETMWQFGQVKVVTFDSCDTPPARNMVVVALTQEPISNNGRWLTSSPVRLGSYTLPST